MAETREKPKILIVGGGFGGAYLANAMERKLKPREADILLINRHNYFAFTPLLVEAGVGSVEPRHAVVSLRRFIRRTRFRMAEVTGVNPQQREVSFRLGDEEDERTELYDHLVLALGSVTRLPPVPGLREHGYQMKSLADAVALRDRAIRMLEIADATEDAQRRRALLHFAVVGANYTGVEVAGEFHELLYRGARRYPNLDPRDVRVTLIELSDRILPTLDRDLADYTAERLARRGVNILLNNTVERIEPERAVLKCDDALSTHTVIWAAGIAPNPLIEKIGLPTDSRGYIRCERDLRVEGHPSIWAIGDAAINPDPDGKPYPPTAQHATRQAYHLAKNLRRVLRAQPAQPCDIKHLGSLAAIGCRSAVAEVVGMKLSGFPAWWLYRTVYLMKMPGWARRLRIAIDWTLNLLFRRDYVQLGLRNSTMSSTASAD